MRCNKQDFTLKTFKKKQKYASTRKHGTALWCGVVLCVVWCGVVLCNVVWCGVVLCVVWCGVV